MATHPVVRRALGSIKMGKAKPIWLDTVARLYPPITFSPPEYVKRTPAGRVPKPPRIVFPEDVFRRKFFADHPLEALRSSTMDERVKLDNSQAGRAIHPDSYSFPSHCRFALTVRTLSRIFHRQSELVDTGIPAEDAYQMALSEYRKRRAKMELEERVAQEQLLQSATIPVSSVIEDFLREERDAMQAKAQSASSTDQRSA